MHALPTGTVTFLFTDIEGSTRLLQRLGAAYQEVLETHNRLIRAAVDGGGGIEVGTAGDGFFVVFPSPARALEAAIAAQRALAAHDWPRAGALGVRMGLHVGTASLSGGNYVGLDVHRAARIAAAGHGGQLLISSTVCAEVQQQLPPSVSLQDLGRHFLRGLDEPEHLFQVVVPGLLREFPPLRTASVRPHNLPSDATDFVGREPELRTLRQLLARERLVTLTGPGGIGKTRLALRAAAGVLPEFTDGVFFVALASLQDPQVVLPALGRTLGVPEVAGRSMLETLCEYLTAKEILLVLDNFEQVLDAAPQIGELLAAAPGVRVLATSRSRLGLRGERIVPIAPLPVPRHESADLPELTSIESVDLFVRRARAADPGFALTPEAGKAVAQIVRSLEGLPLAIELAAVQSRLFSPPELARRLGESFAILRGGQRDLPARHRSLRDTIAWSYQLLSPAERTLFRRLAVFVGGFTLEAAQAVAGGPPVVDVVESVALLFDQSLLQRRVEHGDVRLSMLETVRAFALDELGTAGETQALTRRHAAFFMALAEEAEPALTRHAQTAAVARLSSDQDNLRAALRFSLEFEEIETGLRLAAAVWRFWQTTGQVQEGRQWLEQLLAGFAGDLHIRARGLAGLAGLAYWQADYQEALARYGEALELYRRLGNRADEADTLLSMSTTLTWSGSVEQGGRLANQALAMFEELGIRDKVGMALMAKGFSRWMGGNLAGARPLWEESLGIAVEVGDEVEAATKRLALASIMFQQGEREAAMVCALQGMEELAGLKNVTLTIMALDWVAALAAHADPTGGVRLAGAAAALRDALGGGMRPEASGVESARTTAARVLDVQTIDRLWARGQALGLNEAVEFARELGAAVLEAGTLR
jgi:predicted ATPase/class 3 adenylate cyclase